MLKDSIWFTKSRESARNIRGVYIGKLRTILKGIGDVTLRNASNYWTIQVGKDVDYDFGRITELIKMIREIPDNTNGNFIELLKLGLKGPLLPNLDYDWLDKFKDYYSNELIDVLQEYSKNLDLREDVKTAIQIADAIFINDPLNEDALRLKCKVLNDNGKHSLAKKVFENFVREYLNSMGTQFNQKFNDLLN